MTHDGAGGATRVALYAGGFIGPFGGGMVTVLIPELRDAFDVSSSAASVALTAYLVPFAALQLVSGTLGERFGRARATRVAFVVYALASLWAAVAGAFAPFLIARALQGAANAFTTPLVLAALADATPEAALGRTMGTFAAVQTAGVVGAPLVGGLAGALDYRLAFVVAAVAALILAWMSPGGGAARQRVKAERPRFVEALTPRTRWTAAAAFLAYLGVTGLGVVVALRAGDAFGLGPTERGLLLAGFGAAGVVAGRPAGGLTDRRGAVGVAVVGAAGCVVLVPLLGIVDQWEGLALVWLVTGVASALLWAGLNVLTVGAAPANRGGAVSVIGAFKFAGNALAPVSWLALYDTSAELAFAGAGGVCVLLAATVTRAGRAAQTRA
ncbi:MFS transporter [Conexibacter woesei]|uniref:MFS transporter n=1 Tax=Conexibacter woesei TaxID=191495 RepID=UPI0003FFCF6A|nr:MFS transporter [Conexibacter woesei]